MKHLIALSMILISLNSQAKVIASDAWARATVAGQAMGGAFVTLRNTGTTDANIVAVQSPAAERSELHIMHEMDGMMHMQATDKITIPAGGTVTLAPKSTHIMLMGLKKPLSAGNTVPMTLTVNEHGATKKISIKATVKALGQ